MITIKLRENAKDIFTSVYPETTIEQIKSKCYPLQWENGDIIMFLFMGNELGDYDTIQDCHINDGDCIIVMISPNDSNIPRRAHQTGRNIQMQRAQHQQSVEQNFIDVVMNWITPGILFVIVGWIFLIVLILRVAFPNFFNFGSDVFLILLLVLYIFMLLKVFIVSA
ncbi:Ubiquitin-like domain-containing protein [Entamoeba marina]